MLQQKLKRISVVLLGISLILTGCSLINCNTYVNMYTDAISLRNVKTYTDYMIISPDTFNKQIDDKFINLLKIKGNVGDIVFNEEQDKRIAKSVDEFRKSSVKIYVGEVNETTNIAKVKVNTYNVYSLYVENINLLAQNEQLYGDYNESITTTIESAFINSERTDRIALEFEVSIDSITGKYYIDDKQESMLFNEIMGIE